MKRYAFVVNNLLDGYQQTLWAGLQRAAADLNVQLVAVPGRDFNSPFDDDKSHNCLFDFLNAPMWDGIVMSAAFGTYNTMEEMSKFCKQYDIPYVSIGVKLDTAPCVLVDNRTGLYDLITHMITKHDIKDIGFIRGPHQNEEAEIRYDVFKKALRDHSLELNPQWIKEGNFENLSGKSCAEEIWKAPKKPRALLAANDQMMVGAMEFLVEQGVDIPKEVSLGGFDDIEECQFLTVPLSTVRQPINEQAYQALHLLHKYAESGQKPQDLTLDTQPVYRESCGCFSTSVMNAGMLLLDSSLMQTKDPMVLIGEVLKKQMKVDPETCRPYQELPGLIRHFENYANLQSQENLISYLSYFSGLLSKEPDKETLEQWNLVLTAGSLAYSHIFPSMREAVESIVQRSYLLVGEKISQHLSHKAIKQAVDFTALQHSLQRIMEAYDMEQILERISQELGNIGFNAFYLALFEGELQTYKDTGLMLPKEAKLRMAFQKGRLMTQQNRVYKSQSLLPQNILSNELSNSMMIQMILFDDKLVGYMLCDTQGSNGEHYESLRSQISSSVRSGYLIEEIQASEKVVRTRSEKIQEKLMPMLQAIDSVVTTIAEKIEMMEQTALQFKENEATFKQTSKSVENIADSAKYMMDLIKVIDDISEQINILSINASIESARAGSHGKGFGVISAEVRKLADSTAQTTTQTRETLDQVMGNIKVSKESSSKSFSTYTTMQGDMNQLAQSLTTIDERMRELKEFSRDIMKLIQS